MNIVINISEESYKNIKKQVDKRDYPDMQIGRAIADGVPICASLSEAISAIHKYQKIEQIVNEYNLQLCDNTSDGAYNFQRIKEVVEDDSN